MRKISRYSIILLIQILCVYNIGLANSNVITVGIQIEGNPFEYIVSNKAIGFNIDILKAIGKKLPVEFIFIQKPYSQLKTDLLDNKIDLLLMTYSSNNNNVNFKLSRPYNNEKLAVFANIDQSFSLNSINTYNLTTDIPEIAELLKTKLNVDCTILSDKSKRETIDNYLQSNNAYYIIPHKIGSHIIDKNGINSVWKIQLNNIELPYCFGFNKNNDSLAYLFDESLKILLKSKEYTELTEKWFGNIEPLNIKKTLVNDTLFWIIIILIVAIAGVFIYRLLRQIRLLKFENADEINRREKAEIETREKDNTLKLILNTIPYPLFVQDSKGNFLLYNDTLLEILGVKETEDIENKLLKIASSDDQYKKVFLNNDPHDQTTRKIIDANGQLRIFQMAKSTFETTNNHELVLTIAHDISKRYKAEKRLEHESALLSSIINAIPDLIFYKDKHFRYLGGNTAFKKFNNFNDDQYIGKTDFELFDTKQAIAFNMVDRNILEENIEERMEKWGILPNGDSALYDTVKVSFRNSQNEVLGLVGISRNITNQYEVNKALTAAKENAEDSNKLKTVFLANISHEIRTPLNSIIGFSDLLLDQELTFDQREDFIEMIRSSGNSLLQLVDDIIDLSKIESNQITLKPSPTKASQILKEVQNHFLEIIQGFEYKDIQLVIKTQTTDDDPTVLIDSFRVKQVLINLVGNAIRYRRHGEIHIGASFKDSFIEFFVDDKEASIQDKLLEKIFERNVFGGGAENYGGSGLNLIISKGLVNLMDGEISITKGEHNKGIVLSFFIPLQTEEPHENLNDINKELSLSEKTLLVAEDEKNNFAFIEETLRKTGINIIWVINGKEALEAVVSNPNIDLILMDIKMPIMDGYTATREIKKRFPDIPIIAQTAYAVSDEKNKSLEAGCDAYLSKPIRPKYLIRIITEFLQ